MVASDPAAGAIAMDPSSRVRARMAVTKYLNALFIHTLLFVLII
jgi:hypothetical protein